MVVVNLYVKIVWQINANVFGCACPGVVAGFVNLSIILLLADI